MATGRNVELPALQAAVLVHLFDNVELLEPIDTLDFKLAGGDRHFAAYGKPKDLSGLQLIFTLGTTSERIYLTVSNGDPVEIARVLCNFEDIDREDGVVTQFQLREFADEYMGKHGWKGALFIPPDNFPSLERLADTADVGGRRYYFSLVIFLSDADVRFGKLRSVGSLLEKIVAEDRDLTSI
jgi:hypothetical protein